MATVEHTTMKVQRILTGGMGLRVEVTQDAYLVRFDDLSTAVEVSVREWTEDRDGNPQTLVVVTSPILSDVPASAPLFEWVARQNGSRWFGRIEVYDDEEPGTVMLVMSHTLLGDYLDERELEVTLWGVLAAADQWDDELQVEFGGRRLIDE